MNILINIFGKINKMAINFKELNEFLTEEESFYIKEVENHIDKVILETYDGNDIYINYDYAMFITNLDKMNLVSVLN